MNTKRIKKRCRLMVIYGLLVTCMFSACAPAPLLSDLPTLRPAKRRSTQAPGESPAPDSTPLPADMAGVEVFLYKSDIQEPLQAFLSRYGAQHFINITVTTTQDDYMTQLLERAAADTLPAIFNVPGGGRPIPNLPLANLSLTQAASQAVFSTLNPVKKNGAAFGLPCGLQGFGLVYNKLIFARAGIDPDTITNFGKLFAIVKKLDSQKDDLHIDSVFALPLLDGRLTGLHMTSPFIGAEFAYDMKRVSNESLTFAYADGFKKILGLQQIYSGQPKEPINTMVQVQELFTMRRVAIMQQGDWVYDDIYALDKKFAQNGIGMLPYPVLGARQDCYPATVPMYWCVNGNLPTQEIDVAANILDALLVSEQGKELTLSLGFVPAYEGFDFEDFKNPLALDLYKAALKGRILPWIHEGYPDGFGTRDMPRWIEAYTLGQMSFDDLVKSAIVSWNYTRPTPAPTPGPISTPNPTPTPKSTPTPKPTKRK